MKRSINNTYYFITSTGEISKKIDRRSIEDERRHKIGNYFSYEEATNHFKQLNSNGFINWIKSLWKKTTHS